MLLPEYLNQVIIISLNVSKHHIDSGNHDILCHGVSQVKHIVNHLTFFRLDDALFMAHVHNGPEFVLRNVVVLLIRVHMKGLKDDQRHPVNEDNERGQHCHQNVNHMAYPQGIPLRLQGSHCLRCYLTKNQNQKRQYAGRGSSGFISKYFRHQHGKHG